MGQGSKQEADELSHPTAQANSSDSGQQKGPNCGVEDSELHHESHQTRGDSNRHVHATAGFVGSARASSAQIRVSGACSGGENS